jgi:hypothetical protein
LEGRYMKRTSSTYPKTQIFPRTREDENFRTMPQYNERLSTGLVETFIHV